MVETVISIRAARLGDEGEIASVHDAAWREAYRGMIPGRELERMIARRGPAWWRLAIARRTPLLVLEFGEAVVGYLSYGRNPVPTLRYGRADSSPLSSPRVRAAPACASRSFPSSAP